MCIKYLTAAEFCLSVSAVTCYEMLKDNGVPMYFPLDQLAKYLIPDNEVDCTPKNVPHACYNKTLIDRETGLKMNNLLQ